MPTYEYECNKCGLRFEEFQSITAEPLTKCKNSGCDGTVKRLFSSGGGFIFKGSGFYITDYRSDSYQKAAKSENSGSSSTGDNSKKPASSESKSTSSPGGTADATKKKNDSSLKSDSSSK